MTRYGSAGRPLTYSLLAHLVLACALVLGQWFLGLSPPDSEGALPILRVDIVDLPRVLKKDLRPGVRSGTNDLQTTLDPSSSTSEALSEPLLQQKNQRALERLASLDKLKHLAGPPGPKNPPVAGNALSGGTSADDQAVTANEGSYLDILRSHIQTQWSLPPWLARQNFHARVTLRINPQGHIAGVDFNQLSGSSAFDDAVRKAIQQSDPFPLPPEEQRNHLAVYGISLGFPL